MVSVIIPTYNRAKLLKKAIASVLAGSYKDIEIIVVDNGSVDNTKEVVDSFEGVQYLKIPNSGGAATPKNVGIKKARGEYIATLDDDDIWFKNKLEKQMQYFEKNKDVSVVGCNYLINNSTEYKIPEYQDVFKRILVVDDMGTGSAMVYKSTVFSKVGLFDENLKSGQDKEMRIRLAKAGFLFGFVREPLLSYSADRNDNISAKGLDISEREKDWEYIYNKYREDYTTELYRQKLRYDGTRYMLLGYPLSARKCFKESGYWFLFLLSFFGFGFYRLLAKMKLWLK